MDSRTGLVEFLKGVTIFSDLSDSELARLAPCFQTRTYQPGEILIKQGEMSRNLFLLFDGFVNVSRGKKESHEDVFICALGPGDYFGEAALFHDMKRSANIQAQDIVQALLIDKTAFLAYLGENPAASGRVLYQMLQQLFLRLDQTSAELQFERKDALAQNAIDKLFK